MSAATPTMLRMSGKPSNQALQTCGSCGSRLVQPTSGRQAKPTVWEVELRCPDCDGHEVSYLSDAELEQLDREQDRAASEIEAELCRLEALHMEEWVDRFVHALDLDLIGPDDF
jgi:transcription initiation factor IIE alpha subunit